MSSSHSSAVHNLHRNASESTFSSGRAASQSVQSVWHTHHRRSNAQAAQTAAAQYKASLTDLWSASGAGCYTEEHASILYPLISHFVELVHQKLSTSGNAAVLDVASGGGQPACSVARALPGCQIVATDLAPGMVHEARRRAELYKLTNFRAVVADAEQLHMFPSSSFGAVTCLAGLMFFPDHERALREWRRVLVPNGLLVAAVTGTADQMQVSDLVGPMLNVLQPEHRALCIANPRPFGGVARLLRSVARAGFLDVRSREFNLAMRIAPGRTAEFVRANPVLAEVLPRVSTTDAHDIVQAAESRLIAAAQQWGYWRQDGSIVLGTNIHTVITATAP